LELEKIAIKSNIVETPTVRRGTLVEILQEIGLEVLNKFQLKTACYFLCRDSHL